jgi:hypothetical protein
MGNGSVCNLYTHIYVVRRGLAASSHSYSLHIGVFFSREHDSICICYANCQQAERCGAANASSEQQITLQHRQASAITLRASNCETSGILTHTAPQRICVICLMVLA